MTNNTMAYSFNDIFGEQKDNMRRIAVKRALISVSDKTGIVELSKALKEAGAEIISTGGTAKKLNEENVPTTDISAITGQAEGFGGRMKTLSFEVSSGILFHRERDKEEALKRNINPIDMIVCNLYPFEKYRNEKADLRTLIEHIDIGGPTMIRSAAKNFEYVAVLTDINDYQNIIKELEENGGTLSISTRAYLMKKALHYTADYDSMIADALDERSGKNSMRLSLIEGKKLRYGENPHQEAIFYTDCASFNPLSRMKILTGKEVSYNNILDIYAAVDAVRNLKKFGCAIIKHNNPCGLAEGGSTREALELAWNGDPLSAFGSVIALNEVFDLESAKFLCLEESDRLKRKFIEVIVAPAFTEESILYLKISKNLRLIEYDPKLADWKKEYRYLGGSLLIQDADEKLYEELKVVTEIKPQEIDRELVEFGLKAVRQVRSNAIVVVRRSGEGKSLQLIGIGAGQPNRVTSTRLALEKARENLMNEAGISDPDSYIKEQMKSSVLVSDAFFPFEDSIYLCAQAGIRTVIQPGGSIADLDVISACNRNGIVMIMNGVRHFKH